MIYENIDDIDYENMDDLPLFNHIEWLQYLSDDSDKEDLYELPWQFV